MHGSFAGFLVLLDAAITIITVTPCLYFGCFASCSHFLNGFATRATIAMSSVNPCPLPTAVWHSLRFFCWATVAHIPVRRPATISHSDGLPLPLTAHSESPPLSLSIASLCARNCRVAVSRGGEDPPVNLTQTPDGNGGHADGP